jgi:hypothetical protein
MDKNGIIQNDKFLKYINNFIDTYMKYMILFAGYIICYIYMFLKRSSVQYISLCFFITLHVLSLLFIVSDKKFSFLNMSSWFDPERIMTTPVIPLWGKSIFIPVIPFVLIGWAFILIATSMMINMYRVLHSKYTKEGLPVLFTDPKTKKMKKYVFILLSLSTTIFWFLCTMIYAKIPFDIPFKSDQTKKDITMIKKLWKYIKFILSNINIFMLVIFIVLSSICVGLSVRLAKQMKTMIDIVH